MVGWYNYLGRLKTEGEVLFLNHGYDDPDTPKLELPAASEKHRYSIQLYNLVVSWVDFRDCDVLDVSSGLGGGVDWIAATLTPRSVTGIDIAADAVAASNARNTHANVKFVSGDAQAMPFENSSFDIVLNVESSLNYPDFGRFLNEVSRVLRPGGHFLFADYRRRKRFEEMQWAIQSLGWQHLYDEDIAEGIVRGLAHTSAAKRNAVERFMPRLIQHTAIRFGKLGDESVAESHAFASGVKRYYATVLRKPFHRNAQEPQRAILGALEQT